MGNQTGNAQRENDNKTAVVVVGVNHLVADPNSPFTYLTARRGLYPVCTLYAVVPRTLHRTSVPLNGIHSAAVTFVTNKSHSSHHFTYQKNPNHALQHPS